MPILEIEFVGDESNSHLAQELANAIGRVLGTSTGQTWVKLRSLPSAQYAENEYNSAEVKPVFVSVLMRKLPEKIQMEEIAKALCATIAKISGRSEENIHVLFLPEGSGRMAFGGNLVT